MIIRSLFTDGDDLVPSDLVSEIAFVSDAKKKQYELGRFASNQ
jgi:hypothetical protein